MLDYTPEQRAHLLLVKEVVAEAIQSEHIVSIKDLVDEVLADINDHSVVSNNSIDRMIDERQAVSLIVR